MYKVGDRVKCVVDYTKYTKIEDDVDEFTGFVTNADDAEIGYLVARDKADKLGISAAGDLEFVIVTEMTLC